MDSYATYLEEENLMQKKRQTQLQPSRELKKIVSISHVAAGHKIDEIYGALNESIVKLLEYSPLVFDENEHLPKQFQNRMEKHRYLNNIKLTVPIDIIR